MTGEEYRPLRLNEVAGTRGVDAINTIMREALGDDWASMLIPQRPDPMPKITVRYPMGEEVTKAFHRSVSEWLDAMRVPYDPPQDAPALGYSTEPLIDAAPDITPPTVTTPDPVVDLVKGYKLISDPT